MRKLVNVLALAVLASLVITESSAKLAPKGTLTRYPIILVPGDGGNRMYAKLNKSSAPHFYCKLKTDDYFLLWFDVQDVTYNVDCFIQNMQLVFDNTTNRTSNYPGVDVRIFDFGKTSSVYNLFSYNVTLTAYYANLIDKLVKDFDYVPNVNVRGAPYDWRRAPNELEEFYANYTSLIEETYQINDNTPVIIVAHSMGNPVTLYWLQNYVSQAWKDKYIRSMVSLSGAWGGAVKSLKSMVSGYNLDIPTVRPIEARPYQRSTPSSAFLAPSPVYWGSNDVLITTPVRNYTVNDYEELFNGLNYPLGYTFRQLTGNLVDYMGPPNVEIHCLYGVNVPTPETLVYPSMQSFPDYQPKELYGNGDGTVNYRSLLAYKNWIGKQKQPILVKELDGVDHASIIKNPVAIDYITQLLYT